MRKEHNQKIFGMKKGILAISENPQDERVYYMYYILNDR